MIDSSEFMMDRTHPSFAGHFPGEPIVPGAMLLDHAISLAERRFARRVRAIPVAKFLTPVQPQQTVVFSITRSNGNLVSLLASTAGATVFSVTMTLEG